MGSIKLPHASGNSMSIGAPATNPASDLELKLPATIGTAGQVLKNSSTPGTLEFGEAITHYSSWRIHTSLASGSSLRTLDANWEASDDTNQGSIGAAMTQSSGVFTFPTSGIWEVVLRAYAYATTEVRWFDAAILSSSNSGGAWYIHGYGVGALFDFSGSDASAANVWNSVILDIQDASTYRVKFTVQSAADVTYYGNGGYNSIAAYFKRVGDT